MEFRKNYAVLRRWRWLIAAAIVAAVAIGIVVKPFPGSDFEATATLTVPSAERSLFLVSGLPPETGSARSASAFALIRSRDVAERAIKRNSFDLRPDDLRRRLSVVADQGTDLIRVTVTGSTPAEAVALTNAVAETAAAVDQETQSRAGTLAREFIEKQVAGARAELRKAEDALLVFKQNNEALSSPKSAQLASLQSEAQHLVLSLNMVEAKLALVRGRMDQQSATRTDKEITDNPIAQQLRSQLVGLEVSLTSELAQHTEKYPSVVALKAKIQAVKDRLTSELTKTVSKEQVQFNPVYDALVQSRISLETEKVALLAESEALRRALTQIRSELPGLDQTQLEQSRLNRNVEILGREYAGLQERLAGARLKEQEVQDLGSLSVANPAGAGHPTSPWSKLARLALAAILGLTAGVALAIALEYLDTSVKTPENAERLLDLPLLAAIPRHNPPFDEAYQLLRVNVAAGEHKREPDVIAVMSPKPREGTSTVVTNLARAFARTGRQTIVVDASLQRPTQHVHFGIPNERGLGDVLAGRVSLDEALAKTDVPNVWVLPTGSISPDDAGLSDDKKMADLFAELKQKSDLILVDTLPGVFADAFAVTSLATGVVIVLDARQSPRGVEGHLKTELDRLGARVLGVVLTKVRQDLVPSYLYQERLSPERPHRGVSPVAMALTLLVLIALVGALVLLIGLWPKNVLSVGLPLTLMHDLTQWDFVRLFGRGL